MFPSPPIDFLECSLRVGFLATFQLRFCQSRPLVRIETCNVLPIVVSLVLDPECSLALQTGQPNIVGDLDPFWP